MFKHTAAAVDLIEGLPLGLDCSKAHLQKLEALQAPMFQDHLFSPQPFVNLWTPHFQRVLPSFLYKVLERLHLGLCENEGTANRIRRQLHLVVHHTQLRSADLGLTALAGQPPARRGRGGIAGLARRLGPFGWPFAGTHWYQTRQHMARIFSETKDQKEDWRWLSVVFACNLHGNLTCWCLGGFKR